MVARFYTTQKLENSGDIMWRIGHIWFFAVLIRMRQTLSNKGMTLYD
jgi:hypothetical protein